MYSASFCWERHVHGGVNWCGFSNSELACSVDCSVLLCRHWIREVIQLDIEHSYCHWSGSDYLLHVHGDSLWQRWHYRKPCRLPRKNRFVLAWCNYPIAPLPIWSWVTLKVILKDFPDARSSCDSQTVLLLSDASFWQTHYSSGARFTKYLTIYHKIILSCWWRGTVVERRSLAGELSLSCARPAADGWPLMWVSHPL